MSEFHIAEGDTLSVLPTFEAGSVQTCITSPPYYGLRDYGTASWEGGDSECDHKPRAQPRGERAANGLTGGKATIDAGTVQRDCHCGARRIDSQIGLEETPEQYVEKMVAVFREVRRLLRDDGTLWLNLGDSYASGEIGRHDGRVEGSGFGARHPGPRQQRRLNTGTKPKDLLGIPWMVAFALRADGWYLRSDVIWAKPNPMPESVTDRPTKAHEYLFLLSKSARYYYDQDAIREPHSRDWHNESVGPAYMTAQDGRLDGGKRQGTGNPEGRNKRTVWTVASQPFPGAHFATFPPKLIEPCVLAGSPAGGTVLDPFSGAGTTGVVALRNDRDYVGVELNPEYAEMSRRRIEDDAPLFNIANA